MGSSSVADDVYRRPMFSIRRVFYRMLLFAVFTDATPTITFPINSQVPPVARVSSLFSFTFSSSTFTSDSPMTYALSIAPSWLSLDSSTRTISGTAPAKDANTAPVIGIIATDSTGSVTMNTTLVISGNPGPTVTIPLQDQLPLFGTYSPPNSLLYYDSTPFKFSFDKKTFTDNALNYYAVTTENTPLPSWLAFDGSTLTFSGLTPDSDSLIQPPQTFGIQLIGSDVLGFAGAAIAFNIVVGAHKLVWSDGLLAINATVGTAVNFNGLSGALQLDGQAAAPGDIANISAATPPWLTFDKSTYALSGTPSPDATSYNVTISATDTYGDSASVIVAVEIATTLFGGQLGSLNATIGKPFSKNISSAFLDPSSVTVSAQIDPASSWLSFDPKTLILSGNVPLTAKPSTVKVEVKAISKSTQKSESEILSLRLVSGPHTTTSVSSSSSSTTTPTTVVTSKAAVVTGAKSPGKGLSKGEIAAIVILPIVFLLALLVCLCCYKRRKYLSATRASTPEKGDISRPIQLEEEEEALFVIPEKSPMRHHAKGSNAYTNTTFFGTKRNTRGTMRRSQTESALDSSYDSSDPRFSHSTSGRARSFSANAVSDYDSSWRSTQDSAYPPLPLGSAGTRSSGRASTRMTRNFSRKAPGPGVQRDDSSEFPLRQSELAFAPYRRLSRTSIQQTPEFAYDSENMKVRRESYKRRTPNYLGAVPNIGKRLSGIGHGSRKSTSGLSFLSDGRRSAAGLGHGTGSNSFESAGDVRIPRDASSWQTIEPVEPLENHRHSTLSALTESTDVLNPSPVRNMGRPTVRQVPMSPASRPPTSRSLLSMSSAGRESRRAAGSSPFFGGSSRTGSTRGPKGISAYRREYDRPLSNTMVDRNATQDSLEKSILQGLRDVPNTPEPPRTRDALGISYSSPREGTRQLQNFVSQMSNRMSAAFRNSFNDNDSRFNSAEPSPASRTEKQRDDEEQAYEREHYGYPSQARLSPLRNSNTDSNTNSNTDSNTESFIYGSEQHPNIEGAPLHSRPSLLAPFHSWSNPNTPNTAPGPEIQGRFMPGPGRPISFDTALTKKKSFTANHFEGVHEGSSDDGNEGSNAAFL